MKLGSRAIRGESNAVCLSFSGQTVSEIFTSDVQFQKFALLIKQFQNVLLAIYSFGTYGMPLIDSFKILVELGQTILACSILADNQFQICLDKYSPLRAIAKEGFYGQGPQNPYFTHYAWKSISGYDSNNEKVRICFQSVSQFFL